MPASSQSKVQTRTRSTGTKLAKAASARSGAEVGAGAVNRELKKLFAVLGVEQSKTNRRKRAIGTGSPSSRTLSHAFLIGDLLTEWSQNPAYLDSRGNPLPLPFKGRKRSFTNLTLSCAPNINARKILVDLKRLGAIRIETSGLIHQLDRSISAYEDRKLATQHTLATLHGFIQTLRHNLVTASASNSEQLFHRIAWNREFDPIDLPRLKIWLKNHGQHFLESTDNWMTRNTNAPKRCLDRRKNTVQVSVGLYLAVNEVPDRTDK